MKKVLSIVLALVMVCALSVSVFADELYSMTTTQGQDQEGISLPGALTMSDGYSRIATNWVGGGSEYSAIIEAINTADTSLVITYTGNISQFIIQTENGGDTDSAIDLAPVEADGKNVATISCADIVAAMPTACANDNVGWGNIALICEDGAVLESFKIVTGAVAAPAENAAPVEDNTPAEASDETPAETTAPAAETAAPAPAKTGIVLAVLPMAVAAAAVVVSKRR